MIMRLHPISAGLALAAFLLSVALSLPTQAQGWSSPCWEKAQNQVAANVASQVQNAQGICQNARASKTMYEMLLREAKKCGVPKAGINELQAMINQSAAAARGSCG